MRRISRLGHPASTVDRQILGLAVPALGALVAEPLFVLVDSAIVGRLGTTELAGLSLASTLLVTVVGLCVFLAYATTAAVARRSGAGDRAGALQMGVDGLWLAAGLGVVLAVVAVAVAPWAVGALGATGDVAHQAVLYLRASAPGLPGMLLVLAATGALRGLQDTRTPLVVAGVGAVVNAVLNVVLVYGAGLGIAGRRRRSRRAAPAPGWGPRSRSSGWGRPSSSWSSAGPGRPGRRSRRQPAASWPACARGLRCCCAPRPCAPRSC